MVKKFFFLIFLSFVLFISTNVHAQALKPSLSTGFGSGLLIQPIDKNKAEAGRAPIAFILNPSYVIEWEEWLEYSVSFYIPVENGTALALIPGIRLWKYGEPLSYYGTFNVAYFYVNPDSMFGIELGGGATYQLWGKYFLPFAEITGSTFLFGNGMPDSGVPLALKCNFGFRYNF